MIQLIATDIDGTLLDENRFISATTAAVFKQIDLPLVLISARMPRAMHYLQRALLIDAAPMICYNGALVLHDHDVLYSESIPFDIVKSIIAIGQQYGLHVSLYRNDEWFVEQMDEWAAREVNNTRTEPQIQSLQTSLKYFEETQEIGGTHKIMFMGDKDKMDLAFAKANSQHSTQLHLYRSKDTYTEISPKGISKKTALELLLARKFPDITMQSVAAFGDNYNDTEMLAAVGYGVAVDNARSEVKAAARYHTDHHKKNGVARWLENTLIHKKTAL